MKEDETIDTFTAKLTTIVNKVVSLGHTIEDSVVIQKLLNSVPDKFLQIVASIEQYSDLDEMSVNEAIGRLKTFEEIIKRSAEITESAEIAESAKTAGSAEIAENAEITKRTEDSRECRKF
ncbi:hypothetical protein Tco_0041036 [Tanacetum coccineum]